MGDYRIQHQWFGMAYIYVIRHSKWGGYLFPILSWPLLDKIQQGGVDALATLKIVHEKGSFSCDCILIIDEMYLQKSAQYQSGVYEGRKFVQRNCCVYGSWI